MIMMTMIMMMRRKFLPPKGDDKRVKQVVESFKQLEKAKKEWMKSREDLDTFLQTEKDEVKIMHERLKIAFKKELLKAAL